MKTQSLPPATGLAPFSLALLAAALLNSGLLVLSVFVPHEAGVLMISYACRLLSLVIGFAGLGGALFGAQNDRLSFSFAALGLTAAANALPQLTAAICDSLYYLDYRFEAALASNLAAALANVLLSFLLPCSIFLFVWLLLFRGRAPAVGERPLFSRRDRRALGAGIATGVLFLYQLSLQLTDTVTFLRDYAPNIYPNEIATIVFDYVFLAVTMLLGYAILYLADLYFSSKQVPRPH